MHNTRTELLLTLNDSDATHFCVAPTARKGASYDLTLAALGKKRKKDLNQDYMDPRSGSNLCSNTVVANVLATS